MSKNEKEVRLGETNYNKQKCLMKIVEYNSNRDIIIEFQDEYKEKIHTNYECFKSGSVKNPYYPSIFRVGILGTKYPSRRNKVISKEYRMWYDMLKRCYDSKYKKERPTYQNVICCNEWLNYENFYEWVHSQENFDRWLNGDYAIDKDILVKGNKIYSPETCCLVPHNVNNLFVKCDGNRGDLPIGVTYNKQHKKYSVKYSLNHHIVNLGYYDTPEEAFEIYKKHKENIIKQVARIEYDKDNIIEKCYQAMINYTVEIDD